MSVAGAVAEPLDSGLAGRLVTAPDAAVAETAPVVVPATLPPPPTPKGQTLRTVALVGLFIIAALAAVFVARDIIIPIVFAVVLQLLLSPVVRVLARLHVPEAAGAAIVLLGVVAFLALSVYTLASPAAEWVDRAPQVTGELQRKLAVLRKPLQDVTKATKQVEAITSVGGETTPRVVVGEPGLLHIVAGNVGAVVLFFGITLILAYFLLASGDLFKQKLVHIMPRLQDKKRALQIMREIERSITRYLVTITLVNVAVGMVVGACMFAIGLPNPLLWAAMAVFLSFVPVIGVWIGIAAIAVVAVLAFDNLAHAAIAPAVYGVVHMMAENFVTPAVLGRRLTLNPVVIVLNVLVLIWLWGIPGALLAGPIIVTVRVLCDHFPSLAAVGELLSGPESGNDAAPRAAAAA